MVFLVEMPVLELADTSVAVLDVQLAPGVDVSAGHQLAVDWAGVPGVDGVTVTDCGLRLTPVAHEQTRPDLPITTSGEARIVTLPAGEYLTALTFTGLARVDGEATTPITSADDLGDRRLTVSLSATTASPFGPPVYAVPVVPHTGQLPDELTGAWLEPGPTPVLRFADRVSARRVQVALATGDDFAAQPMALTAVAARTETLPTDLTVTGPDGATAWAAAGESVPGTPPLEIDLTVPAQLALQSALPSASSGSPGSGAPGASTTPGAGPASGSSTSSAGAAAAVSVVFTVSGGAGSHVRVDLDGAVGALTRTFGGVHTVEVAGSPAVADAFTDLPAMVPSSVTGDLTITYLGLRLHPWLSDALPPAGTALAGPVVRADGPAVLRPLPAPGPLPLARVGLHGIRQDAELTVALVRPDGTPIAPGPLAERRLQSNGLGEGPLHPTGSAAETVWFDVPADVAQAAATAEGPLALSVRATRGRFLWAATANPAAISAAAANPTATTNPAGTVTTGPAATNPAAGPASTGPAGAGPATSGQAAAEVPVARFVIVDPQPPTTGVRIGTATLASIGADGVHVAAAALPAAAFAGTPPLADSELFVRVDLSDVVLRYAR